MKSLFNIFCLCEEYVMRCYESFPQILKEQISCSYNLDKFSVATPQRAFTCSKSTIKTLGVKLKFTMKPQRKFVSLLTLVIFHTFLVFPLLILNRQMYAEVKVNKRNTRTSSKLTIKMPKQHRRSGIFIVKFEQTSHLVLVIPLLTLNR